MESFYILYILSFFFFNNMDAKESRACQFKVKVGKNCQSDRTTRKRSMANLSYTNSKLERKGGRKKAEKAGVPTREDPLECLILAY